VTLPVVLAVDGGNSKTDLALVRADGELLGHARGPQSSPHHLGLDGCLQVLDGLLIQAAALAGLDGDRPLAEVGRVLLAGIDFPDEEARLWEAITARDWTTRLQVGNDTFAVLRAGSRRGWGVGIVCGAGINCVGVSADGAEVRFPALGAISGDWGGGYDVGLSALSAAARSEDGRGPRTSLEQAVPRHFGLETPLAVSRAVHGGGIHTRRLHELAPLVFAEAETDEVAAGIVERLAEEIVALARGALTRLGLEGEEVEVVVGGGLIRSGDRRLLGAVERGLRDLDPRAILRPTSLPPIVGAALLGLDDLGAGKQAQERIRRELVGALGGDEQPVLDPALAALDGGPADG
jgi:N-acetylglucosamine kinase-like BadF-type ATPase